MIDEWGKGATYWDHAWNPVIGCKPISEGCDHCYAKEMVARFWDRSYADECWNGGLYHTSKKPPRKGVVFVGNMTDLFGEWNSREYIRSGVCLAGLSHAAVNLVLTKRAKRLPEVLIPYGAAFPHVWYGVTAENDARFEERIPHLVGLCNDPMRKPEIRSHLWLSLEPLLGPVDLSQYLVSGNYYAVRCAHCGWTGTSMLCPGSDDYYTCPNCWEGEPGDIGDSLVEWVVVGAESGPNRRPCKIEWVESIVEQCQNANVPVFVKQIHLNGKLVKDINKFPEHLQIRQVPWKNN